MAFTKLYILKNFMLSLIIFIALVFFIAVGSLAGLTFAVFLVINDFFFCLACFPGFCLLGLGFGGL